MNVLFRRMNFVRRNRTNSAKSKVIKEVKDQSQRDYLRNTHTVEESAMVPTERVINIDQTPVKVVPLYQIAH